jgi:RcsF protein
MINKTNFIASLFIIFSTLACQNNYQVSTNLDQDNFQDYFSPSKVTIYQQETEFTNLYKYLGAVEGEDCQLKPHHVAPDKINARTAARGKAFAQGANAIIFTGCALIDQTNSQNNSLLTNKQCHAVMVCYGKAYKIAESADNKK